MLVPSSHQLRGGIQPHPGYPLSLLWVHMASGWLGAPFGLGKGC